MKLLTSQCQKAWLFDTVQDEFAIQAGFACFLPNCDSIISFTIKGKEVSAITPIRAAGSVVPVRILNARLALR